MIPFKYEPDSRKIQFVLDLETLSLKPDAAIIDIALVEVGGGGRQFSMQIKPSCYNELPGFHVSDDTVKWHAKNDPAYFALCEQRGETAQTAAVKLNEFLRDIQEMEQKQVLFHIQGVDFDKPILQNFLTQFNLIPEFHYRNFRDLRTVQAMTPEISYKAGNHTALEDAKASKDDLIKRAYANPTIGKWILGV